MIQSVPATTTLVNRPRPKTAVDGTKGPMRQTATIAVGEPKGIHNQTAKTAKTDIQMDTEIYKCFKGRVLGKMIFHQKLA